MCKLLQNMLWKREKGKIPWQKTILLKSAFQNAYHYYTISWKIKIDWLSHTLQNRIFISKFIGKMMKNCSCCKIVKKHAKSKLWTYCMQWKLATLLSQIPMYHWISACRLANFSICYIKLQKLTHFWPIFTSK